MDHEYFLKVAADEARNSCSDELLMAGAVLVKGEEIIARGHTRCKKLNNPMATAEMDCIRQAGRRNDQTNLVLYSSRYPDMLIAGTVVQFSIGAVVIGLTESSNQAIKFLRSKGVPITFVPSDECAALGNQ